MGGQEAEDVARLRRLGRNQQQDDRCHQGRRHGGSASDERYLQAKKQTVLSQLMISVVVGFDISTGRLMPMKAHRDQII